MTWKKERDLLIAQTMAFVQSVAGKTANTERSFEARLPLVPTDHSHSATVERRPADVFPARLTPISHGDMRDEIRRRVATFRARQQVFDRERDEYCNAMMEKLRAAREELTKPRDNQSRKR